MIKLWNNPKVKNLRVVLAAVATVISIIYSIFELFHNKDSSNVHINNSQLYSSPVIVNSPGASVLSSENDDKVQSIYVTAVLEGSKVKDSETPPKEVSFIPVGTSSSAFLEAKNGQRAYLDFVSPVYFSESNGNIRVENNFALRSVSVIQGQPLIRMKDYLKLFVPIETVIFGKGIEKMEKLEIIMQVNNKIMYHNSWSYDSAFKNSPTFEIPLYN